MLTALHYFATSLRGSCIGLVAMCRMPERPVLCLVIGLTFAVLGPLMLWAWEEWTSRVTLMVKFPGKEEWHYLCGQKPRVKESQKRRADSVDAT